MHHNVNFISIYVRIYVNHVKNICYLVSVWIRMKATFCILRFTFFFFPARISALGDKSTVHALLSTIHTLFSTVYGLKNIKNGSHSTIHTFKNYDDFLVEFVVCSLLLC